MSQQRVFRKEFGFSSGQIGECAEHKGGRWWFHPAQKTFLQRMEVETDTLFDGGVYTQHELNLSFVKMGVLKSRMNLVYGTRLSQAAANKLVPSCAIYQFHERMSQVASTGAVPMESSVRLWRDSGSPFLWKGTEQISASQFDGWAWQKPFPAS